MALAPKPKRQPNNHQKIISRFVTVEFSVGKGFWPNEMRIAGQLIKKYSIEFLLWIKPPNNYKVTSLVWFLTSEGKHYLSDQLVEYQKQSPSLFPKQEEISLSETKIGEDISVIQKPKSLKDFLNYGKSTS